MTPASPAASRATGVAIGAARTLVVAWLVALSVAALISHWKGFYPLDMADYWDAAMRLRAGDPLYIAGEGGRVAEYRYAPWFAYLWVPITHYPRDLVTALWITTLGAASAALIIDVGRRGWAGLAIASFLGVQLLWWVRGGNVQPIMVAALYFGIGSRAGPLAIAAAATLKIVPFVFILVYAARREWVRVAWTVMLSGLLAAPLVLHDLSNYGSGVDLAETNLSLYLVSPWLWALVAFATLLGTGYAALKRSRTAPLWAAATAILALPRLFLGDSTLLLVAVGASKGSSLRESDHEHPGGQPVHGTKST